MFYRLQNSWNLFGSTLQVLSHDKELLLFPVLSGLAAIVVIASFAGGMWGAGMLNEETFAALDDPDKPLLVAENIPALIIAFMFYFANFFVMTYFNAALVGAAYIRLQGGDPTIRDGLTAANRCLPSIIGYAAIAATVGLILRLIEGRSRGVARFVTGLLGIAWSLVTYLIVPVLVIERQGAIKSVGRSAGLLKETWGEQIIANFGFGIVGSLLALPGLGLIALGMWMMAGLGGGPVPLIVCVALAVVYWLFLGLLISALRGIYTAALYAHATHKPVQGFPNDLVAGAFSRR